MSTEPFIGEVKWLAFNFAPIGFMTCSGQSLAISQYTALFSLIGTTYGGDGQTTFGLPDLQGRVPVHQGTGWGLPTVYMGEKSGSYSVNMSTANIPAHIHTMGAATASVAVNGNGGGENSPDGGFFGTNTNEGFYAATAGSNEYMSPGVIIPSGTTLSTGTGTPIGIANPLLCINYSIAVEGIFPSRN